MEQLPIVVGSVAFAPIVSAIIDLAKKIGLPVKLAPWLNLLLSIVVVVVWQLVSMGHLDTASVEMAASVIVGFLAAFGVYKSQLLRLA